MKLFYQEAGSISEIPLWVFLHDGYMYSHSSFFGLMRIIVTQWKNPNHMIG